MEIVFNLYGISLLVAGGIAGLISFTTFLKPGRSVRMFAWMMAGVAIWALGYALELSTRTIEGMLFFIRMEYIGIALIPPFWLLFCFRFTQYDSWINGKNLSGIFLYPALTIILVWTNGWHGLHYADTSVVEQGELFLLNIEVGPWYIIHTILFYLYMLAGFLALIKKHRPANEIIRNQLKIVIAGVLIPWTANALYLMGIRPMGHLDITPFAFVISGIIVSFGLTRFRLFEILPIAREKIIEDMNEGILILDSQLQMLDSNPSMRTILDEIESDLLHDPVLSVEEDGMIPLVDLLEFENPPLAELDIELGDRRRSFEVNVNQFLNRKGEMTGYFVIFRDITAQNEAKQEIIRSREQAEAASRAKSEFLAHMSHEIRTPLNGVIGFVDLLMETELSPAQLRYMSTVQSSARSLLDIVNDILDLSKIEAGKLELHLEETDIKELCRETFDIFALQAGKKKLDMRLVMGPDVPAHILADSVRLRQIFTNLLGNAIKFTSEGGIEFRVEAISSSGKEHLLRFSIKDTGIGIAEENQKRIFDSFAQEDISTTRKYSGTGLGLAISNRLLALMDSNIQLESRRGEGSRFYFDLPVKATTRETVDEGYIYRPSTDDLFDGKGTGSGEGVTPDHSSIQEEFRVLVADDQSVNVLLVTSIIRNEFPGAKILEAQNGKEAQELYSKYQPDLVFMDVQMPEMNGFEATRLIRELQEDRPVPIIALTAGTTKEEQKNCFEAGMDDYLSKPVKPESIKRMILKWLDLESAKR